MHSLRLILIGRAWFLRRTIGQFDQGYWIVRRVDNHIQTIQSKGKLFIFASYLRDTIGFHVICENVKCVPMALRGDSKRIKETGRSEILDGCATDRTTCKMCASSGARRSLAIILCLAEYTVPWQDNAVGTSSGGTKSTLFANRWRARLRLLWTYQTKSTMSLWLPWWWSCWITSTKPIISRFGICRYSCVSSTAWQWL